MDDGWKRMKNALKGPEAQRALKAELKRATQLNAKLAEAQIRKTIRKGGFARNAALTIAIKGSTKPLVDQGQLFQFITSKTIGDSTVFVGMLRTDDDYNIGMAIHQGAAIPVTNAMRGLFFVLWQASSGRMPASKLTGRAADLFERMPDGWYPLKDSTKVIIIPPRPFIAQALAAADFKAKIVGNWNMAVVRALKHRAGEK